jgi:two-component sensor histidine kinase
VRRYHLWQFRTIEEEQTGGTEELEESVRERDSLLRKTHQTVRNDLQIIYGVLKLQSGRVRDALAQNFLAADQTRIMAIALVHERLTNSPEANTLDFPEYAKKLIDQLIQSYGSDSRDIHVKFELEPLPLSLGTAIPCGLIINELVTNSLRYAFPDKGPGEILIHFRQKDGSKIRLLVRDNGVGFPTNLDFRKTSTLGMMLVTGLTEQLGGTIALNNSNGTEFDISFPMNGSSPQPSVPAPRESCPAPHQSQVVS